MIKKDDQLQRIWDRWEREDAEEQERRRIRNEQEGPVRIVSFAMSDEESRRFQRWYDEHHKVCVHINYKLAREMGCKTGASGGALTYRFTPTGIGLAVNVECFCGVKIDCTDYDSW